MTSSSYKKRYIRRIVVGGSYKAEFSYLTQQRSKQASKQTTTTKKQKKTKKTKTKTKDEHLESHITEIMLLHLNIYHVIWIQDISDLEIMVYCKVPDDNEIVTITAQNAVNYM